MRGLLGIQKYVSGGEIASIYDALFDRGVDSEGAAYYGPGGKGDLSNVSYEEAVKIIAGGARNQDIATEAEMAQAIQDFNKLMDSGNYAAAASFANNAGVDPNVTANYVNEVYGDRFGGTTVTADVVNQAAQNYDAGTSAASTGPTPANFLNSLNAAYGDILGRPADPEGINYYTNTKGFGSDNVLSAAEIEEIRRNAQPEIQIKDIFQEYFNREPTLEELIKYQNAYKSGNTIDATERQSILSDLGYVSPEAQATNAQNQAYENAKALVDKYYGTVLNRAPTQAGYDYWIPEILEGRTTEASIIDDIIYGSKNPTDASAALNYALTANLDSFKNLVSSGDYAGAKTLLDQTISKYNLDPAASYSNIANFLNTNFPDLTAENRALFTGTNIANANFEEPYAFAPTSGLAAIPAPLQFLPGGAAAQGRIESDFLRTAAPTIATNPVTGQPVLQGPTGLFATPTRGAAPVGEAPVALVNTPTTEMATGGDVKYAGTEPPLTPKDLGSTFDIEKYYKSQGSYIDPKTGKVVVGGLLLGAPSRDVVFNRILAMREEEARGMSDEEREAARRGLIVRQGMTGVDPYAGGLAGIVAREAMMRNRPQYYSYAKGGDVSATAQDLASRGRSGDTMLVHMAPHEVAGLNAIARMQGTELTINPETGMPEALKLGKLFKQLAPFIPFIPGVGQFMAPFLPSGLAAWGAANPLLAKAVASGVIGGFTGPKGGFDLQRGLMQGITAYGMSNLMQNLGPATATPGGVPGGPSTVAPEFGGVNPMAGAENLPVFDPMAGIEATTVPTPVDSGGFQGMADTARVQGITSPMMGAEVPPPTAESFNIGPDGEFMIAGEGEVPTPKQSFEMRPVSQRPLPYGVKGVPGLDPSVAAPPPTSTGLSTPQALLTTGLGATSLIDYDKSLAAQLAIEDEEKKNKRAYQKLFASTLGRVPIYGRRVTGASGGLAKLAGGGMTYMEAGGTNGPTGTPREVTGTGDGMSDSVPASIEGVQEARLADGEFVIPADVVADIGNGSSDAGSKKLYDMMDRVRKARHGTTEQPPEIKAERLMPA